MTMSNMKQEEPVFAGLSVTAPAVPITGPAVPPSVELSLTVTFIVLYSFLFVLVYVQLFLILYYKHKRKSYQTVFLFLCLIWAALRTTLFSFYINNCDLANTLNVVPYFLLYCFPVCLQFTTLCLLVVYFGQVVFKAKIRYEPEKYKRKKCLLRTSFAFLVIVFFFVNLLAVIISARYEGAAKTIVHVRVIVSGILFFTGGITLSVVIWNLARMTSAMVLLEARGTTVCQATTACIVITFLYLTRTVYNIVAVVNNGKDSFGYNWMNVSDQADYRNLKGYRYITFGIVLFLWEFLPTFILIIFFRVRRYASRVNAPEVKNVNGTTSKAYFFDNPRRYDSEDDLCRTFSTNNVPQDIISTDLHSPCTPINGTPQLGYGTIIRSNSYSGTQYIMPGTTPPLLFSGRVSISGYQQIYD